MSDQGTASTSKPTPEERIRELAKKSSIGASDAARLLAAVKTEPVPPGKKLDPFARLNPVTGALIGFAVSAGAAAVSRLGVRYSGALDVFKGANVSWRTAATDQVAAFLLPAAIFWIAGYALARRGRPVDMLSTVGVARVPQVALSLPIALLGSGSSEGHAPSIFGWCLIGLVFVGTALQIYLLVIGFRTATGLQGSRLGFGVVGGIVVAEVASKVFLSFV